MGFWTIPLCLTLACGLWVIFWAAWVAWTVDDIIEAKSREEEQWLKKLLT